METSGIPNFREAHRRADVDVATWHLSCAWNAWVGTLERFRKDLDDTPAFIHSTGEPMLVTETGNTRTGNQRQ